MRNEIVPLTSLRFFAAFFVYAFHVRAFVYPEIDELTGFISYGYIWVDFFFLLSGFVLAYNYSQRLSSKSLLKFFVARIARIYPVHIVTLLLSVLLFVFAFFLGISYKSESADLATIPAQLMLVHAWGFFDHKSLNEPSWSISAEWFAYLFFPVALFSIKHIGNNFFCLQSR
ncbi:MAG: acyltransferase [Planctomycetota bacterium]